MPLNCTCCSCEGTWVTTLLSHTGGIISSSLAVIFYNIDRNHPNTKRQRQDTPSAFLFTIAVDAYILVQGEITGWTGKAIDPRHHSFNADLYING